MGENAARGGVMTGDMPAHGRKGFSSASQPRAVFKKIK